MPDPAPAPAPTQPAPAPVPAKGPPVPPSPAPAAEPPADPGELQPWMKKRLASAKQTAAKEAAEAIAKELGMTPAQARERLAQLQKLEDAQKSEAQLAREQIEALSPKAKLAEQYAQQIAQYAEAQYNRLPEAQQKLVADAAGDDPQARLRLMTAMVSNAAAFAPAAAAAEADPAAAAAAAAVPDPASSAPPKAKQTPPPAPDSPDALYARYQKLPAMARGPFMAKHGDKIRQAQAYKNAQ